MAVPSLSVIRHGCLLHSLACTDLMLQLLSNGVTWYPVPVSSEIGTPENGHPGCPFSHKHRHPDAHSYVNTGIPMPIFTVSMGIPL